MNYAEDRLDRRARQDSDVLQREFAQACRSGENDHASLARVLGLSLGWNHQAIYHYAVAWMSNPYSCEAAGDFAQMAELAGFPEIGLLALLAFRSQGKLLPPPLPQSSKTENTSWNKREAISVGWLQQQSAVAMKGRDCGCGDIACGVSACFIPMTESAVEDVLGTLDEYCRGRLHWQYQFQNTKADNQAVPTAHEILGMLSEKQPVDRSEIHPTVPKLLQFWKDDNDFHPLSPVVKLLLIKLLYLVLPSLAMEASVYICFDENDSNASGSYLAAHYKSHWAYYIFMKSLVLGERIKPGRRHMLKFYHVPLWDRLWGLDHGNERARVGDPYNSLKQMTNALFSNLQQLLTALRDGTDASFLPCLCWIPSSLYQAEVTPIFVVGDSHVLSLAWQTIRVPTDGKTAATSRLLVPVLTTGLKAWHVRSSTRFFTHTCLRTMLQRLPKNVQTLLVSAGEIDCREGMGGPLLEGYTQACHGHVQSTVREYVTALAEMVDMQQQLCQILVLPVAPHLQRSKGRMVGQASRRETMRVWNNELRKLLPHQNKIFFLDYTDQLQAVSSDAYALNPVFNADSTHMNSAFAPILEGALVTCGCDLSKL